MYPQQGSQVNYGAAQVLDVGKDLAQIQMYYDRMAVGAAMQDRQEKIRKQEKDLEAKNKFTLSQALPVDPRGQSEFDNEVKKQLEALSLLETPTQNDYYNASVALAKAQNAINSYFQSWEKGSPALESQGYNTEALRSQAEIANSGKGYTEMAQSGWTPQQAAENMPFASSALNVPKVVNQIEQSLNDGQYTIQGSDGVSRAVRTKVIYEQDPTNPKGFRVKRGQDGLVSNEAYATLMQDPRMYRAAHDNVWMEAVDKALLSSGQEVNDKNRRAVIVAIQSGEEGDVLAEKARAQYDAIPAEEKTKIEKKWLTETLDPLAAGTYSLDAYNAQDAQFKSRASGSTWYVGNTPVISAVGQEVVEHPTDSKKDMTLDVGVLTRKGNINATTDDGFGFNISHLARSNNGKYYVKGQIPMKDGKGVPEEEFRIAVQTGQSAKYTMNETGWVEMNPSMMQAVVSDGGIVSHKENVKASLDDIWKKIVSPGTSSSGTQKQQTNNFTITTKK